LFPLASVFPAVIVLSCCRKGKKILAYAGTDSILYNLLILFCPSLLVVFQVISQNEADYFFDSLRQLTDWTKRNKPVKDGKETASMTRSCMRYCVELGKQQTGLIPSYHMCDRVLFYHFYLYICGYCLHQQ